MKTSFKSVEIEDDGISTFPSIGVLRDENKNPYDCELIVLFTAEDTGVVIHNKDCDRPWAGFGKNSDSWHMPQFRKMRPGEEIIIKG